MGQVFATLKRNKISHNSQYFIYNIISCINFKWWKKVWWSNTTQSNIFLILCNHRWWKTKHLSRHIEKIQIDKYLLKMTTQVEQYGPYTDIDGYFTTILRAKVCRNIWRSNTDRIIVRVRSTNSRKPWKFSLVYGAVLLRQVLRANTAYLLP